MNLNDDLLVSVVIPAYNEEDNIEIIVEKIETAISKSHRYEIIFIDDGSTDSTLAHVKNMAETSKNVNYISFSRNFGHQIALKAGIDNSSGDCVISMDADLQHPPEIIPELLQKWNEGFDVVYTVRKDGKKTPLIKRLTSRLFYKLINFMSDVNIEAGSADFRLLDKSVTNVLKEMPENNIFLRGMISWLGFKQVSIQYMVHKRHSGQSKYSIRKMFSFAFNGITSFSTKPLRISIILGLMLSLFSLVYAIYALVMYFISENVVSGWSSTIASILFIGGIQLFILGIIGEYIGKLFIQSKNRPTYIIRETNLKNDDEKRVR